MDTFFKYSFSLERLTAQTGDKEKYVAVSGTIQGFITSLAGEDTMLSEGNPAESAVLFTSADSDIRIGDRVTDEDGKKYIVRGVKAPKRLFALEYKRCIIEKLETR